MAFDMKTALTGTLLLCVIAIIGIGGYVSMAEHYGVSTADDDPHINSLMAQANSSFVSMQNTSTLARGYLENRQVGTLGVINDMYEGTYNTVRLLFEMPSILLGFIVIAISSSPIGLSSIWTSAAMTVIVFTIISFIVMLIFFLVRR